MSKAVAIVTGASSGIGKATAIRLARDFSGVVLAARGAAALSEVADEVRARGAEPLALEIDLMAATAAESVVSRTLAKFGRIDALLNIAGAVPGIDLFQMTDEQWSAGAELKLHGARRLTLRAWEALKAAKGSVVLMAGRRDSDGLRGRRRRHQRGDRRARQGVCRSRPSGRRPGQ
jgi:3-oxoacyl-[acyl-carrier protein] reductase